MNSKQSRLITTIIVVLGTALTLAVLVAAQNESTTYYGCVHKRTGAIRVFQEKKPCRGVEFAIEFNSRGPQGPEGPVAVPDVQVIVEGVEGPQGPAGPKGDPGVIRFYGSEWQTVTVAPNSYSSGYAYCDEGDVAVSGSFGADARLTGISSQKANWQDDLWVVGARNNQTDPLVLGYQAICADLTP